MNRPPCNSTSTDAPLVPDYPPLAWLDGSLIEMGQRVRCERKRPIRGTWDRYDGREGVVVAVNHSICEDRQPVHVGEVGVNVGASGATAWFKPDELTLRTPVRNRVSPSQPLSRAGRSIPLGADTVERYETVPPTPKDMRVKPFQARLLELTPVSLGATSAGSAFIRPLAAFSRVRTRS